MLQDNRSQSNAKKDPFIPAHPQAVIRVHSYRNASIGRKLAARQAG